MTVIKEYPTYLEIESWIEAELDLDIGDDGFISRAEMMGYCNKAIDRAEQHVHSLYEDYYLCRDVMQLEYGREEYDLPLDIYAHKIRGLVDMTNGDVFEITREREWRKFIAYRLRNQNAGSDTGPFKWFLVNAQPGVPQMIIAPVPRTARTVERWYLRQASRIVGPGDICDIPEGKNYLMAFLRERVIYKQTHGSPESASLQTAKAELAEEERLLVETLGAMVPDADNEMEADYRHYEEHL